MSCLLSFLYLLHALRSALQGIGCGIATILSGIMEFVARVSIALYFSRYFGEIVLYFAEPSAWMAAALILIIMSIYKFRRILNLMRDFS